ncbi:hypothetical protein G9A89_020316 [Geosiphon pyriformis]|nr:hypothetical protein G9A89_020316 [Geosiphon pyriformis]
MVARFSLAVVPFYLVPVVTPSLSSLPAVSETLTSDVDSDMIVDTALVSSSTLPSVIHDAVVELSSNSSKVLTAKVGGLETKLIALEASVGSVLDKLNILCSGSGMNNCAKQADIICWHKDMNNLVSIVTETKLKGMVRPWIANKFDGVHVFTSGLNSGHMRSGVAIIMDSSLAKHVCKISEVPGRLLSIRLLFGNKLSVSILGLYAGASSVASDINSLIVRAVNKTSFVILGGDFNEDGFHKCASFRKCFDLGLVNSLSGSTFVKLPTWCNSCGVAKMIDYVLVSSSLVNAIMDCGMVGVEDFFDTDHRAVSVSFNVKNASERKWLEFKNATAANASMLSDTFVAAIKFLDKDAIRTFKKKWFKSYNSVFNKISSRFHRLELLVSKLVKASCLVFGGNFASLLDTWIRLNLVGALPVKSLFLLGSGFDAIHSELAKARKVYHSSKMMESKCAEESCVRQAIERRMESFEVDKGCTIRSVLERPFHKMVLNHLVAGEELVLELNLVKSKVDKIMEDWTRKCAVPLNYVFNDVFSEVMCLIGFDELLTVVSNLPDGKAAGLSGIFNELWKHCDRKILDMLLLLLNFCLEHESDVLTNTHPIALIEMAHKILSKILSNRISSACSRFDVLCGDNFSVLKGTMTQLPIFAIGSVVEDVLEKGWKLWLVLQDIRSLVKIKMCDKFVKFFDNIHNGHTNRVMTDFGLTNGYHVHNGLDQEERIFYDSLLCEVKRQESMCGYRLNSHFISRTGQVKPQARLTLFLAAGAFVDDTIWVGDSQTAMQHILNVANEFFRINDISINNDKTVAIPINSRIVNPSLTISSSPISIAKKSLSTPSLAKAHSDVRFFVNLVLRKVVSDKQFAYLASAVLLPIISYRTQFSFIFVSVCNKWDSMVCRCLKSKFGLPLNFPNDTSKLAAVLAFTNSVGILGHLFSHRFHNLQAISWHPCHPLLFPVHIYVSPSNNFLSGVVHIFSGCDLSLGASLASAFHLWSGTLMSLVLSEPRFLKCVLLLKHYGIAFVEQLHNRHGVAFSWKTFKHWKKLDLRGPVPFLGSVVPSSVCSLPVSDYASPDIHLSRNFGTVCNNLLDIDTAVRLFVYMDGSLNGLDTVGMKTSAAVFFEDIDSELGVKVSGLVSSMLTELQAIALALECVPSFHLVDLFSDSQAALDACKSESLLTWPDFRNCCWIEHHYIANIIRNKNLDVNWIKVKGHSGVPGNKFLRAGESAISGNSRHFVHDIFRSIHQVHWEVGFGSRVLVDNLSVSVWHPDFHMAAGFTSLHTAGFRTYFMKALHHQLPVAVHKHLYDRLYSSVVCLFCGDVEISDHVFSCSFDAVGREHLMNTYVAVWKAHSDLSHSSLCISQLLFTCTLNCVVGVALCKGFIFNNWYCKFVSVFKDSRVVACNIVVFVHEIWLVRVKHWAVMKKGRLIPRDGSIPVSVSGFSMGLSAGVIRLLGVANAIGIRFGFHRSCLFFSGACEEVSVHIST